MRRRTGAACLGAVGLVVLTVGTFLPWLRSGGARRNSYQTDGALQRLLALHGPLGVALSAWSFLALAGALVVVIFAVGLHRVAAVLGALLALIVGGVAVAALRVNGSTVAAPVTIGPQVTLFGATIVVAAATLIFVFARKA